MWPILLLTTEGRTTVSPTIPACYCLNFSWDLPLTHPSSVTVSCGCLLSSHCGIVTTETLKLGQSVTYDPWSSSVLNNKLFSEGLLILTLPSMESSNCHAEGAIFRVNPAVPVVYNTMVFPWSSCHWSTVSQELPWCLQRKMSLPGCPEEHPKLLVLCSALSSISLEFLVLLSALSWFLEFYLFALLNCHFPGVLIPGPGEAVFHYFTPFFLIHKMIFLKLDYDFLIQARAS